MWLLLLLQLAGSSGGSSGRETLCMADACFTLHFDPLSFEKAQKNCVDNGGNLVTTRNREEDDNLRSVLMLMDARLQERPLKLWLGLKLHKKTCVLQNEPLRGFQWVLEGGEHDYSNWNREPNSTCTKEMCVKVDCSSLEQNALRWNAGSCKREAPYVCKFSFRGMCEPLSLLGAGRISYTAPFSNEPLKQRLKLLPIGTYANIFCGDEELYTVCRSEGGSFSWSHPGPFCQSSRLNCRRRNGGCEQECVQKKDAALCSCRAGYELEEDGFSCRRTDRCGPEDCEYQCVMEVSGFSCTCPKGFELSGNKRNCSDTDECLTGVCGDHGCTNTRGSFRCVCREGFELTADGCSDVDECARPGCEHGCINTVGSFSCVRPKECDEGPTCSASTQAPLVSSPDPSGKQTQDALTGSTEELQHQSPYTDAPRRPHVTPGEPNANSSAAASEAAAARKRLLVCVLGSVVPLLVLIAATLFIVIIRCSRDKKEVKKKKKKNTTDGYCWVSSGLDPRLEKLYESILTDDL